MELSGAAPHLNKIVFISKVVSDLRGGGGLLAVTDTFILPRIDEICFTGDT